VSIAIVKTFLIQNCLKSHKKLALNFHIWVQMGSKCNFFCFWDLQKVFLAWNDVIWRIYRKNGAKVLAVDCWNYPKKLAESLDAHFRIFGGKKGNCIVMKVYIGKGSRMQILVTHWFSFLANVNSCSRSLYVVVRPSVVCLSVCLSSVYNVRAPYSADWNFRQCFCAI